VAIVVIAFVPTEAEAETKADAILSKLEHYLEHYIVSVSFDEIPDPEERDYSMNLPTSFVLSAGAVDRLRDIAGGLMRQSPDYQRMLRASVAPLPAPTLLRPEGDTDGPRHAARRPASGMLWRGSGGDERRAGCSGVVVNGIGHNQSVGVALRIPKSGLTGAKSTVSLRAEDLKYHSRWYDYSRARDAMFVATGRSGVASSRDRRFAA
jgi:hypothetical protein